MNQDYVRTLKHSGELSQRSARHDATILNFTRFRIPLTAALSSECTWLLTWQSLLTPGVNGSPWQCLFRAASSIGVNNKQWKQFTSSSMIQKIRNVSIIFQINLTLNEHLALICYFQEPMSKWSYKSFNTTVKQSLLRKR